MHRRLSCAARGTPVAFVGANGEDVCEIDDLTEGEARWIAVEIRQRRKQWFGGA